MLTKRDYMALPVAVPDKPGPWIGKAHAEYTKEGYDILVVDIYHYGELQARYFADPVRRRFCGWGQKTGWHSKIKMNNLAIIENGGIAKSGYDYYCQAVDMDDKSYDTAMTMLRGNSIQNFENAIESTVYYTRRQRKDQRDHDAATAAAGDIPGGYAEWAIRIGGEWAVELTTDDGHEYQCTSCAEKWTREKRYARKSVKCPHCGADLRVKRGKAEDVHTTYVIAAAADGTKRWSMRQIKTWREWLGSSMYLRIEEEIMAVIDAGESLGDLYYVEGYRDDEPVYTSRNPYSRHFRKGFLFPDFGGADDMLKEVQRHELHAIADAGIECNINYAQMNQCEIVEYLVKGGLTRLAKEIIGGQAEKIKNDKDLGINRDRIHRLKQMQGGGFELAWLRYEQATGKKVPQEILEKAIKSRIDIREQNCWKMLSIIQSPTKFVNYLLKQAKMMEKTPLQTAADYADYIRMAELQGLNLDASLFRMPKDLEQAHNECVKAAKKVEIELKEKRTLERFPGIQEIIAGLGEKYDYSSGDYCIVAPRRVMDIMDEGRALGHCVDTTDRYFDRIQHHVTYLVFLRRAERPEKPWYTLEIEPGGTIRQQRTTGNRQNTEDQKAYMPFIREWQRQLKDKLSELDRQRQAESTEIRKAEYAELREKKELVRHGYAQGTLLVDLLEADLVENVG